MATVVDKNPANDPSMKPVKNRSSFKPNRSLYQTLLFGYNTPHVAFETVEGDNVSIRVNSDVDTLNMVAPVMTPVKMSKDYFFASLRAILPKNAELVITNPLTGEDIVQENVLPVMSASALGVYRGAVCSWLNTQNSNASASTTARMSALNLLRALVVATQYGEPFFSHGSLMNVLGANVANLVYWSVTGSRKMRSYDEYYEALCDALVSRIDSFDIQEIYYAPGTTYSPTAAPATSTRGLTVDCTAGTDDGIAASSNTISFRRFLDELRQGMIVSAVSNITFKSSVDTTQPFFVPQESGGTAPLYLSYTDSIRKDYNLNRLVAYQLTCAQFYTDDAVDYVYNCKLWHQNQMSAAAYALGPTNLANFRYALNGVVMEYDSISGYVINAILNGVNSIFNTSTPTSSDTTASIYANSQFTAKPWFLAYINNLFGYTRSLKFRDYFCGSKVRPMAVGNVDVQVSGGQFSVVDVTKNIQIQRFLNQVNRVGRKFNEYVMGIFGVAPQKDPTEVVFLGHASEFVGAEETNETAGALLTQAQTTRSKMRRNSSQFAFEGQFNEPGVCIGICNFDVARPYTTTCDRAFFHYNRFDMFNPYLQHIGDQAVEGAEIFPTQQDNFGYQLRYAEYKQQTDRAVGGFVNFLPGFAFLNTPVTLQPAYGTSIKITPDFIRARCTELDKFFNVMSHYSLGGYFHFIARHDVQINALRPMEAAPSIL